MSLLAFLAATAARIQDTFMDTYNINAPLVIILNSKLESKRPCGASISPDLWSDEESTWTDVDGVSTSADSESDDDEDGKDVFGVEEVC